MRGECYRHHHEILSARKKTSAGERLGLYFLPCLPFPGSYFSFQILLSGSALATMIHQYDMIRRKHKEQGGGKHWLPIASRALHHRNRQTEADWADRMKGASFSNGANASGDTKASDTQSEAPRAGMFKASGKGTMGAERMRPIKPSSVRG